MARVLILDAEALSALVHARARAVDGQRARAILTIAHEQGASVRVDAFVVATAIDIGGALIATHDPNDITRLAAGEPSVQVRRI